jgi:hypothetical protein
MPEGHVQEEERQEALHERHVQPEAAWNRLQGRRALSERDLFPGSDPAGLFQRRDRLQWPVRRYRPGFRQLWRM